MTNEIWSTTDFPYICLKDSKRTKIFRQAIRNVVNKGDIVLDIGAGSGILSFFAAEAGAKRVYAVEIEPFLAETIRKSVTANSLDNVIKVLEGNAVDLELPKDIDIVIAELIETGLLDEQQVPVLNSLNNKHYINATTQFIPYRYTTSLQLVNTDNKYYGFTILSPKHEWPFYKSNDTDWYRTTISPVTNVVDINSVTFGNKIIDTHIDTTVSFKRTSNLPANAIRITGKVYLSKEIIIDSCLALNGDKILSINPVTELGEINMKISYERGGGLHSFQATQI